MRINLPTLIFKRIFKIEDTGKKKVVYKILRTLKVSFSFTKSDYKFFTDYAISYESRSTEKQKKKNKRIFIICITPSLCDLYAHDFLID